MFQAFSWVLFGFAVWGLVILLHALQRRYAPDLDSSDLGMGMGDDGMGSSKRRQVQLISDQKAAHDKEIAELKKRIEVLEAIVTDKKFQFDQELNR